MTGCTQVFGPLPSCTRLPNEKPTAKGANNAHRRIQGIKCALHQGADSFKVCARIDTPICAQKFRCGLRVSNSKALVYSNADNPQKSVEISKLTNDCASNGPSSAKFAAYTGRKHTHQSPALCKCPLSGRGGQMKNTYVEVSFQPTSDLRNQHLRVMAFASATHVTTKEQSLSRVLPNRGVNKKQTSAQNV